jgi:hypothetical protein
MTTLTSELRATVLDELATQTIELPSWAIGNSPRPGNHTRFCECRGWQVVGLVVTVSPVQSLEPRQ